MSIELKYVSRVIIQTAPLFIPPSSSNADPATISTNTSLLISPKYERLDPKESSLNRTLVNPPLVLLIFW